MSLVAPALCAGNAVVVLASEANPLVAITLAEILATSDLPAGVVNVLTGAKAEIGPWLAAHGDVDTIDVTGAVDELATEMEQRRGRRREARRAAARPGRRLVGRRRRIAVRRDGDDGAQDRLAPKGRC